MVGRRERKLIQTRDAIAKAALALFDSRGFEQTAMEEIADAADIAKGTLYNHFSSKEAVLAHSIYLQLETDLADRRNSLLAYPSFRARIEALLTESAIWCEGHRTYLKHFIHYEIQRVCGPGAHAPVQDNALIATYVVLIEAAQTAGEIRSDLAPDRLATILHYLYFASLLRWLTIDDLDLQDEFASIVDLFVNGAAQQTARTPGRRRAYRRDVAS